MAKKKKQKKVGVEKRRQSKQNRKTAQKRKLIAQQPVQQKISPSKIKQNLKNLPSLIFEPELEEIAFSKEQIEAVREQHEKIPDQIDALGTAEFLVQLKEQHEAMKLRFDQQGDANKGMMVHAILYFMEQENAPAYLNQIAVAMYYNGVHLLGNEEPLDLKQLNQALKEYDQDWSDYLKEKSDLLEQELGVSSPSGVAEQLTEEEERLIAPSTFEALVEEFVQHLNNEATLTEETRERMQEDVEVLVNDFFEEKGIEDLENIRARKIKTFLEGWFIQTMHPTKEDLGNMIESLEAFFKFAGETGKLSSEKSKEILDLLGDKEAFLKNLEF